MKGRTMMNLALAVEQEHEAVSLDSLARVSLAENDNDIDLAVQAVLDQLRNDPQLWMALQPYIQAIGEFQPLRSAHEKQLKSLAKELPIWPWVADIKGFGELNCAAIVGECAAPLTDYRSPSAVWKRLGLAVIDGERQRRHKDAEKALLHGYSPARRSVAWNLGECLIKAGAKCRYREVYDERKAYELARLEEDKKGRQGHAHNRAARYMTKRVLRDLWAEWRKTG